MAYLSASVFFLFEVRISLGRDLWHFYTVFGIITASVCAFSAVPVLVEYFISGRLISSNVPQAVLTLAISIFASMRLTHSLSLFEDTEAKTVAIIRKAEEAAHTHTAAKTQVTEETEKQPQEENENYTIDLDTDNK